MSEEDIKLDEIVEPLDEVPAGELTEVFKETLLDEAPASEPIDPDQLTELDQLQDPGENPNPILAVEEMLDAATLEEPLLPVMNKGAENIPTFQVFLSLKPEQKEIFQKIAVQFSIDPNSQAISHLTEYQAISLGRELRLAQIHFQMKLDLPISGNSEDDLALGSLLTVTESPVTDTESVPEVILPKDEKGVLLFSGNEIPGYLMVQTLELVTAHRSLARRFFRDEEMQEQINREISQLGSHALPKSKVEALFRDLFLDLQKNALSQGGNAVCSVRIEAFPETNHLDPGLEQMRLVALGTAAVVEKITI